jgi:hypothetical protein
LNRAALKRLRTKLAPPALALIFALGFLKGVPKAVPLLTAPQAALSRPAAALHLASAGAGPFLPMELPEAASMLVAGGALMAFGLTGRKRRAGKASEPR